MTQDKALAKNIAGEITLSENPGRVLKKWREIFTVKQCDIAKSMQISSSVISDYEAGRRPSPGIQFIKRYIETLISEDMRRGGRTVAKFAEEDKSEAILDIREFLKPVSSQKIIEAVDGEVVVGAESGPCDLWGYTVIDSIKAILELSEREFIGIYGLREDRALIFTKVHMGRSPLIAIKVTHPKPKIIILHGLAPKKVDRLALKIANLEKIPLIVSRTESEEALVKNLREHFS